MMTALNTHTLLWKIRKSLQQPHQLHHHLLSHMSVLDQLVMLAWLLQFFGILQLVFIQALAAGCMNFTQPIRFASHILIILLATYSVSGPLHLQVNVVSRSCRNVLTKSAGPRSRMSFILANIMINQ